MGFQIRCPFPFLSPGPPQSTPHSQGERTTSSIPSCVRYSPALLSYSLCLFSAAHTSSTLRLYLCSSLTAPVNTLVPRRTTQPLSCKPRSASSSRRRPHCRHSSMQLRSGSPRQRHRQHLYPSPLMRRLAWRLRGPTCDLWRRALAGHSMAASYAAAIETWPRYNRGFAIFDPTLLLLLLPLSRTTTTLIIRPMGATYLSPLFCPLSMSLLPNAPPTGPRRNIELLLVPTKSNR